MVSIDLCYTPVFYIPNIVYIERLTIPNFSLITMALVALNMDFVRPEIVTEGRGIIIKGGRHPLLEMYTENYVRNDFTSTDESGIVKIITGPNASGKSVYMKQVC